MKINPTQITANILFFIFIFYFVQRKKYILSAICSIACASYIAMNLDIGTISNVQHQDSIARYVDWSLTTPLLLFTLLRACHLRDPSLYVFLLTLDVIMIYTGYLAGVTDTTQKRNVLFSISCVFYALLFVFVFRISFKTHLGLAFFLFFAWMVYPVLWYLHQIPDSDPYLNNDSYNASIAALDVFSKIGYGLLLPL